MKVVHSPAAGLRRRLTRVLVAALAAAALLVAMAWTVGAFSYRTNLSRTASRISALPDVAENGQYVAAVWADFEDTPPDVDGRIRLKRSPVLDSPFWGEHKLVFDPAGDGNGLEARLALGGTAPYTDAHVVWLKGAENDPTEIRYSMCDISSSGMTLDCNPDGELIESVALDNIVQPDVAVDDTGTVHAVWVNTNLSAVRYSSRPKSGSWASPQTVANNGSAPTIAYAEAGGTDYLHLAWVDDVSDEIKYLRGQISGGTTTWGSGETFGNGSLLSAGSPSISASGSNVMLVWDAAIVAGSTYAVAYNYSSTSGGGWQLAGAEWRLIPTGGYLTPFPDSVKRTSSEAGTYRKRLQPDVTLEYTNTNTYAHVVWHEETAPAGEGSERYDVLYSSADFSDLNTCSDCWVTPSNVTSSTKSVASSFDSAAAAIAVGQSLTHTVYMEQRGIVWDAYYNGQLDGSGGPRYLPIIFKNSGG